MGGWDWGEGRLSRGLAVKLSPQPRATATSPVYSRQITGDSDRGGSEETAGPPRDALPDIVKINVTAAVTD